MSAFTSRGVLPLVLSSLLVSAGASSAPTVTLDNATVIGFTNDSVTSYYGIPYAEPPVGDLRLRPPKAVAAYKGTINATQVATQCLQLTQPADYTGMPVEILQDLVAYGTLLGGTTDAPQSEDCLTITVQVPEGVTTDEKLPVIARPPHSNHVTLGGFVTGSTAQFPAEAVVRRSAELNEPVVYVGMNYRYATFGFLGGSEVKEAGVGNLGLRDQRLALEWVHKYISAFGGDPDKVTLWGVSAGAISVSTHLLANGGDPAGLFRGAVMQSGSPLPTGDLELQQPVFNALVANTTCVSSNATLDCLRQLSAEEFLQAAINASSVDDIREPWGPHADGVFLERPAAELIKNGSVAPVPFITGDVLDEGTEFVIGEFNITTDEQFRAYIEQGWYPGAPRDAHEPLYALYPSDPAAGSPFGTGSANVLFPQFKRLAAFQGDMAFQAPRRFFLDQRADKQPTWSFISERLSLPGFGSAHATDYVQTARQGNDFADYLIHFAHTLDPNGASNRTIAWPRYDTEQRQILRLLDGEGEAPLVLGNDAARLEAMKTVTELSLKYPM
ncbi:alpha/beta-hydrolase [Trametes elegans]|nr:alpha/beta-hydrolase [Trametes elegans]